MGKQKWVLRTHHLGPQCAPVAMMGVGTWHSCRPRRSTMRTPLLCFCFLRRLRLPRGENQQCCGLILLSPEKITLGWSCFFGQRHRKKEYQVLCKTLTCCSCTNCSGSSSSLVFWGLKQNGIFSLSFVLTCVFQLLANCCSSNEADWYEDYEKYLILRRNIPWF